MPFGKQNYLQNWIGNLEHKIAAKQILILGYNNKDLNFEKNLKEKFAKYEGSIYIDKISKINKKSIQENKGKSILIYTTSNINFSWFDNFKNTDYEFIFAQINTIEDLNSINNIYSFNQSINSYLLRKLNPIEILNDINIVENLISIFIDSQSNLLFKFTQNSIKEYLYRGKYFIDLQRIRTDIEFYKSTFLLTSRLAIFIYKLCKLEPLASEKEIGEFYAKIFGKSRTFNNKKFSISNTKGYPTKQFIYQNRNTLREEIALKLQERGIPPETILYATNIDINRIQS